ncbi:hypothetical protein [Nocardia mexicana]|uniref:DUF8176 domain-containing protein n=1 Tax=Nocardia mexicana TaxID=279262 RepID=A0A370GMF2_9NOCA|nr:hypothetical protein [Nocardia mexicana]RDI43594.1 hypothetical protein DFR68_12061 [Nocardia mexicana]
MPHNSTTDTDPRTGDEWGWLNTPPATPIRPTATRELDPAPEPGAEWTWLDQTHTDQPTPRHTPIRPRIPARAWVVAGAIASVIALIVIGATATRDPGTRTGAPTLTAAPPTTLPAAARACDGLTGTMVTDRAGDATSVAGVVAAFEQAYYVQRSADAALRLVAPETGLAPEGLAAGIASIPVGSTHCVAITPLSDTAANVHIVELHPDRQRVDYLQVINTRPAEGGTVLISNIQGQG